MCLTCQFITVIIESGQGKGAISNPALGDHRVRTSPTWKLMGGRVKICLKLHNRNPAKLAEVRWPGLCAETLFVLLLKFGAVLSIICGFLVTVYIWIHLLQCIVVVRSFLRLIKLRKLAVC